MVQTLLDISHDSRRSGALPFASGMGSTRTRTSTTSALISRTKGVSDCHEHEKCNYSDYRQVDGRHLPVPPNQCDNESHAAIVNYGKLYPHMTE